MTKDSLMKIPIVAVVLTAVLFLGMTEAMAEAVPGTQLPQRITLTATDIPLVQMLGKIEQASDYIFVYQEDVASERATVSIDVKDADIKEVLEKILPKGISYRMSGRQILLHRDDVPAPPQQA